jgi:hypothetical protein
MKIFKIFILAMVILFPWSTLAAQTNCRVTTEAGAQRIDAIVGNLRDCASGTSGISIENNSINAADGKDNFRDRVLELASGFMRYAALFAVAALVAAGVMYTTAYGDGERLKTAKDTAIFALIGLIVALVSFPLVNAVLAIIYGAVG